MFGAHAAPIEVRLTASEPSDCAMLAARAAERLRFAVDQPLRGRRVLVVRAADRQSKIENALAAAGAELQTVTVSRLRALPPPADLEQRLRAADWIACTSRNGIEHLHLGLGSPRWPAGARIAVVGESTAATCERLGLGDELLHAEPGTAAGLARTMLDHGCAAGQRVLFPCACDARPELEQVLTAAGVLVERLPLYAIEPLADDELAALAPEPADLVVFTSPGAVARFLAAGHQLPGAHAIAIGPTTATALRAHHIEPVHSATTPNPLGILRAATACTTTP
jgi:uroporphyrinogen-III synthase